MRNIVVLTSFAAIHSLDNLPIDNREFIVTETLSKFPPSSFPLSLPYVLNGLSSFLRTSDRRSERWMYSTLS